MNVRVCDEALLLQKEACEGNNTNDDKGNRDKRNMQESQFKPVLPPARLTAGLTACSKPSDIKLSLRLNRFSQESSSDELKLCTERGTP